MNKLTKTGFTLIELMIALAIIGLLTTIVYPHYQTYLTRARRSDGQTALIDLAIRMENYYANTMTYQTATIGRGHLTDVLSDAKSPEGFYNLRIKEASETSYLLLATPIGAQAYSDTACQTLTFNHLGMKGIDKGPAGPPTNTAFTCWV